MLKKLYSLFNRPFPLIETNQEKFFLSIIIGIFVFIFLSVFQPFELNKLKEFKYLYFVGYGTVSFLVEIFFTFTLMKFFDRFYSVERWTLGKHIINVFFFVTSLAFFNWLFTIWIVEPNYSSFIPFLIDTLAIGFFPAIFIFIYLERKFRLKNIELSNKINRNFIRNSEISDYSNISSSIAIEGKKINLGDFLYAKSLGNYVQIVYFNNKKVKKEVVRTTMKKIEDSLGKNNIVIRCHKSYFVNIQKVTNSIGNARSLYLEIEGIDMQIPVSRKVAKELFSKVA